MEDERDSALVEDKLQKREDGSFITPREANKTTDTTFDRIYKSMHSKSRVELTPEETKILNRWEKAWLLLCRHRTRNAVASLIIKLFNVSQATAYDDVRNAMNLFSDPREDMKAAKRAIAEDNYLKGADKAWKNGDLEMHKKYMDSYSKVNGLENDDSEDEFTKMIKHYKATQIILTYKKDDVEREAQKILEAIQDVEHQVVE